MVVLNKGNNADKVRLTLTADYPLLSFDHYKLVFTSRQTKRVITIDDLEDTSLFPERYNLFTVDTETEFDGEQEGFWDYKAYGVTVVLLIPTSTLLEEGTMKLNPATAFEFTSYTPADNTFKVYERQD